MENSGDAQTAMDFSRIQDTSDGDVEFEQELFTVFLEDCEARIGLLRAAISSESLAPVHMEAHTIKGAGANVGTSKLHDIAADIERLDAGALAEKGSALFGELETEFVRVKTAITDYLNKQKA
tara:strand:- start:28 stop:396 length:369 start_codon:yes stop_codon:yes gene_type:complete